MSSKDVDICSIAIIEYEERLAGLLTQFFTAEGFDISFVAYNEKYAVASFSTSDPRPGIIVLDHRDNIMNGYKIMQEIRVIKPDIKVIFLSPDQDAKEHAISSGASIFLKKPASLLDIHNAVKNILLDPISR